MEESITARAHGWGGLAEDYYNRGKLVEAFKAHNKAADLFAQSLSDAKDIQSVEALKLLAINHRRRAAVVQKELEQQSLADDRPEDTADREQRGIASDEDLPEDSDSLSGVSDATSEQSTSSGQAPAKQASDPFDAFWDYVESLVDKISNPVAFATAPVGNVPVATRASDGSSPVASPSIMESFYVVLNKPDVPDGSGKGSPTESHEQPVKGSANPVEPLTENAELKATVAKLQKQVRHLEQAAKENTMLKSSIYNFRQEVHKRAMDFKRASVGHRSLYRSEIESSTKHEACNRQIKELESEVSKLRLIVKRQDDLLAKYKDRWDKLKVSAKKKRDAKLERQAAPHPDATRQ
ncbi:hypothetical protein H4R35_004210 [Dimargaris xerosporica]|nr:hypothetical protein H4R35_004210 [Dimargaris xerosporica]